MDGMAVADIRLQQGREGRDVRELAKHTKEKDASLDEK
jgi:hypothetical protein